MYFMFSVIQVPPLLVIELLHRIMDIIKDYFRAVNEGVIKDQYVIVYEVCIFNV